MSAAARLPLVAVPLRPEARAGTPRRLFQNRVYFEAIEAAGGAVMPVALGGNQERLRAVYDRCDAVCLPGGPDVVPQLYGEEPREDCNVDASPEQDAVDVSLARWAVDDGKPLLAICRGMQVLNVALGGSLWQDVNVQAGSRLAHRHEVRDAVVHGLETEPGSRLRGLIGERADVNSLHHQAVRDVAPELEVTAHAPDGLIEGIEHPGTRFVVGIQCHPEELYLHHPWAARLFEELVASARE